jgi:hypothetical protein
MLLSNISLFSLTLFYIYCCNYCRLTKKREGDDFFSLIFICNLYNIFDSSTHEKKENFFSVLHCLVTEKKSGKIYKRKLKKTMEVDAG